ncbi:hypothetical protein ABVT39_010693 [Epinephelus coioides]
MPNSKWMENVEEEKPTKQQKTKKATCPAKEASDQMIEGLQKELMAKQAALEPTSESEESLDEDPLPRNWSKTQLQIKELQAENKRLKEANVKEILDAMKELPQVVEMLKGIIENLPTSSHASMSSWSIQSMDSPMSAHASPQVDSDDMVNTSHRKLC